MFIEQDIHVRTSMQVIPVMDLMGGVAVHAVRGERSHYAPLHSRFAPDARPETVAGALLALGPFNRLYIADLDAIQHGLPQWECIGRLMLQFPEVEWWIDGGFPSLASLAEASRQLFHFLPPSRREEMRIRWVAGTETLRNVPAAGLAGRQDNSNVPWVLSLDFGPEGFRGNPQWLEHSEWWPEDVIVMTLARVGSAGGPDLDRLTQVLRKAGERNVYLAGGVRDASDVRALTRLGAAGVLAATALHDGSLDPRTIKE
jgi:phosphoribosylformimino-5-aminoimidazole carboxamide ribotide isomerase